ncbi:MAG: DUF1684 domain-containing protein [Ardenticatenaceae bacterium]
MATPSNAFTLADWRRSVAEMYGAVRQASDGESGAAWERFRAARDELFLSHSQTPLLLEQREAFSGISYYSYDPSWRVIGRLDGEVKRERFEVNLGEDGLFRYSRVGRVHFTVHGQEAELSLFWIEGYGGGLFLPFLDATSGKTTYGGGRYLYDSIKGADLGINGQTMVLDFNYAYNPSCSYNHLWVCPLSPPENRLPFAVEAGEMMSQWSEGLVG